MEKFNEQVCSFIEVYALFELLDNYHTKLYIDNLEYRENTELELTNYLAAAKKSMSEMGEHYDYHNYDYGVEQELRHEELAAIAQQSFYEEAKELHSLAIAEMKVMFLYKEVEIRLKKVISIKYGKNTNKLSSLSALKECFASQKVQIEQIPEYIACNQLRLVTNDLKHSLTINTSSEISGFRGKHKFSSEDLRDFLGCVTPKIVIFFESLVTLICGKVISSDFDEGLGDVSF